MPNTFERPWADSLKKFAPQIPSRWEPERWLHLLPTQYIYYFRDSTAETLDRVALQSSNAVAIATSVTNATVFTMEDFSGTVQTNSQNNAVTSVLLQVRSVAPKTGVPDSYQVRAKITRRNLL